MILESERGRNPVPVVRRTLKRAVQEDFDVCIIDTSGRLSNNFELVDELQVLDMTLMIVEYLLLLTTYCRV